jgi:hypothetical protein
LRQNPQNFIQGRPVPENFVNSVPKADPQFQRHYCTKVQWLAGISGDNHRNKTAMNTLPMILQVVSGAAGGNIAGVLFSNLNLGAIGNSVAGMIGGALGGYIFHSVWASGAGTTDMQIFLTSLVGGTVGGAVMTVIIGALKGLLIRRP